MCQPPAVLFKAAHTCPSPWFARPGAAGLFYHWRRIMAPAIEVWNLTPAGVIYTDSPLVLLPTAACGGALSKLPILPAEVGLN